MKKKFILPIPLLLSALTYLLQWGWSEMPEWVAPVSRILFWIFLSAAVVLSIIAFRDKLISLIPIRIKIENKRRGETEKSKMTEISKLQKEQEGHEEQWLRPVIEWIDFNRQGLPKNQIILKYQIDSGLVYNFKPYRMWLKLKIGQYEPKDGWEILQTPNLSKCKRTQLASEIFTIYDDDLLKIIEGCRQGFQIAQTLKIIVQLREGESLKVLEGSYSVNPYSEFSQETRK